MFIYFFRYFLKQYNTQEKSILLTCTCLYMLTISSLHVVMMHLSLWLNNLLPKNKKYKIWVSWTGIQECNTNVIHLLVSLRQISKYSANVLTKFHGWYCTLAFTDTPMEENIKLPKQTEEYQEKLLPRCQEYVKNYPYRQVVGSLLYLAILTRPDIIFAVHTVANHSYHPTLESVHACNRILNYIDHTQHLGLTFCPGDIRLTSSLADVIENRKFTGALIQHIGASLSTMQQARRLWLPTTYWQNSTISNTMYHCMKTMKPVSRLFYSTPVSTRQSTQKTRSTTLEIQFNRRLLTLSKSILKFNQWMLSQRLLVEKSFCVIQTYSWVPVHYANSWKTPPFFVYKSS